MPNQAQRSILLLTEWGDPRFIHGVARYAKQAHWHLNIDYVYGRTLPNTWVGDGCIHLIESKEASAFIAKLNLPTPRVKVDSASNGIQAADYFMGLGFRHFACYSTSYHAGAAPSRVGAYQQRLDDHGFSCTEIHGGRMRVGDEVEWEVRKNELIKELTALPKPTAVFCVDDRMALRIVEACMACDIDIPNEVAVLGVGNLELACECSAVPISSIRINYETLGYTKAAQLDEILDGAASEEIIIPSEGIEERQSTHTLAVQSPAGRKAFRFMLDHYNRPISLEEICKAGGITRRQLNNIAQNELNSSPGKILEGLRVKQACELLLYTDYPIKRVAFDSGLGTALRLQRIFRKRFQCTPSVWRKQRLEEASYSRSYPPLP